MPNRLLKESIKYSEQIDKLSFFEESVFYRLIITVDDFGAYFGNPIVIKNELYPLKENISSEDIKNALGNMEKLGLIELYEVEGTSYLLLKTWNKHQQVRTKRHKYPLPDISHNLQQSATSCNNLQQVETDCSKSLTKSESESESESEIDDDMHASENSVDWKGLLSKMQRSVQREREAFVGMDQKHIDESLEAIRDVCVSIRDPVIVSGINNCRKSTADKIFAKSQSIYQPEIAGIAQRPVGNKEGYLRTCIENMFKKE